MLISTFLSITTAATLSSVLPPAFPVDTTMPPEPQVSVTVDSTRSEIIVTAGPFHLPDMSDMKDMPEMMHQTSSLMRFNWPVQGWLRGFRVDMRDAAGNPIPSSVLHHLIGVNFDRRQLVYHAVERLFGWGSETDPVELPKSLGVPLNQGEQLGMYAMFHNETGKDINTAYLRLTLLYTPKQGNHPTEVLPLYVDVNNVIGGVTTFDIPPGKSSKSYTFEIPVGVRVIGVGGHLHDYGTAVELQDAQSGKVLVRLKAKRDKDGHVLGVGRFIFGFNADALHLLPHHPYRVIGFYDNPTSDTVKAGAMAHINGAVVPDDMSKWPRLNPNDPLIQKDVAALPNMSDMRQAAHTSANRTKHTGHIENAGHQMKMDNMPMNHMHDSSKPDSTRTPNHP